MTPKEYYNATAKEKMTAVSIEAGTSFENFQQIALYRGACSSRLAKRLAAASGQKMTILEILYPEEQQTLDKQFSA